MQARVTAILVARDGERYLERTLAAIAAQSRRPDATVFVDAGSRDSSHELLAAADATQFVPLLGKVSFGQAIAKALRVIAPAEGDDEWLWLLRHDSAPEATALSSLLGAVEIAPSVAIAGPKLMRWDREGFIAEYGESVTRGGASVSLVADELDQGQHDRQSDLLGVAAEGMLIRRSVFAALGGFDPALPGIDSALDLCIRTRLAGHRVIGVPDARVASDGGPESFGRLAVSRAKKASLSREAQLHRRMVYAPWGALVFIWLALVPTAIVRSFGAIAAKRPWEIPGGFGAAIRTSFDPGVASARQNFSRTRLLGMDAIAPFFIPASDARELAAIRAQRDMVDERPVASVIRPGFFTGGGAWVVIAMAVVGIVAYIPILGSPAIAGGSTLPLSGDPATLWSHIGYGWRSVGGGFIGAADPFSYVIAVLGSIFFWAPSTGVVVLFLSALPLAALAAWFCAARFARRGWAPAVAAILWSLSPSFLESLNGAQIGAVLVHLLLPWLTLAVVNAARSWAASAAASILFAITVASAPILAGPLLILLFVWILAQPRSVFRIIGIPIPALALFFPLILAQIQRGNVVAILADPGATALTRAPSGWQLIFGSPASGFDGWGEFSRAIGLSHFSSPLIVAALLAPLAALALLALFLPGSRRTIPAMGIALLGFVTAVASTHIEVAHLGSTTTSLWAGAALSLYWLGLVGAVVVAVEALARVAVVPSLLALVGGVALAVPLIAAPLLGTTTMKTSTGRLLPAFVAAEAANAPTLGTLKLIPQVDGAIAATLERGAGSTLDDQSSLAATSRTVSANQRTIATLGANLSTVSGLDISHDMEKLRIAFVLIPDGGETNADAVRAKAVDALEANPAFTTIGETSKGLLWHYNSLDVSAKPLGPSPAGTSFGIAVLWIQGVIFGIVLLLAIPTRLRRRSTGADSVADHADTFEDDDNA